MTHRSSPRPFDYMPELTLAVFRAMVHDSISEDALREEVNRAGLVVLPKFRLWPNRPLRRVTSTFWRRALLLLICLLVLVLWMLQIVGYYLLRVIAGLVWVVGTMPRAFMRTWRGDPA